MATKKPIRIITTITTINTEALGILAKRKTISHMKTKKIQQIVAGGLISLCFSQAAQSASGNHMDIIGFYTPFKLEEAGGSVSNMKAVMRASLAGANQMYEDSNIDFSFSFARILPADIPQEELDEGNGPLWDFMYASEGQGKIERNAIGADYWIIWSSYRGGLGAAARDGSGAVIANDGSEIVAHEIGHSLDTEHWFGYNFTGESGTKYRTIMRKNQGPGMDIPRFSDPTATFDGVPLGAEATEDTVARDSVGRIAEKEQIGFLTSLKDINPGGAPSARWAVTHRNTGKTLGAGGPWPLIGQVAKIWTYQGTSNHLWYFDPPSENNTTVLRSSWNPSRFLTVKDSNVGAQATMENFSDNKSKFQILGAGNGYIKLKNKKSNKTIYPEGDDPGNGAEIIQMWDWNRNKTQWYLQSPD